MKKNFAIVIGLLFFSLACFGAELELSPVFGSNMVLQRRAVVPVWGTANAGENVSVRFAGQLIQTRADEKGRKKRNINITRFIINPLFFIFTPF